jgi:hypothetical protein
MELSEITKILRDRVANKCLNGHDVERDVYVCWRCGSHVETDIQRAVRRAEEIREICQCKNPMHRGW